MPLLDAYTVADLLDEIGTRMELSGESPFKVRAYHNGAEVLRALKIPLAGLVEERKLKALPGIGEALAEKISKLHRTGTHPLLERLREDVPDGLLRLVALPGLGPKKALRLREDLGIGDLDALERAIDDGSLAKAKGFSAKAAEKLKHALGFVRASAGRLRLNDADALLAAAAEEIRALPGVKDVAPAGEARRRCETVGELRLVAAADRPERLPAKAGPGERVRVLAVKPDRFGAALLCATGSEGHLEALNARAKQEGLVLEDGGLSRKGKAVATPAEADVYESLKLPFVEPELREGRGELDAKNLKARAKLVAGADVKGIVHCHSTYSDGANTLEQMAEAVRAMGLQYFGIADHSKSAGYAGGLKEDRVKRQREEVDALNARYAKEKVAFRVFHGIESDIREDGSLDYDDEVLSSFDYVVASVHSRFDLDEAAQTARIVKAVSHPAATILGHATGRLLLRREGYKVDLEQVLAACAKHGVAVEINAHPVRLDLDWRWHARALELGAWLSINPDAHNVEELKLVAYGVAVARKGGVPPDKVLNALDAKAFEKHLLARRKRWKN